MKVVVAVSDPMVVRDVQFCLKVRWPDVSVLSALEGEKAIDTVATEMPDLVITDSHVRDIDTTELIMRIRELSRVPLIVLVQEHNEMDNVRWLEAGADDCMNSPFSPIELLTKVKVLLRRTWGVGFNYEEDRTFAINDKLTVNAGTREVLVSEKPVKLTSTEYRILLELVKNEGRVVSNELLLERVWGHEYVSDIGFVKRYVYRLRQKLNDYKGKPLILSERGIGYRMLRSR